MTSRGALSSRGVRSTNYLATLYPFFVNMSMQYEKLAISIEDQINLLQERGLIIGNQDFTKAKLNYIGYYHLSSYFKSFQNTQTNTFHKNITFEQVLNLYGVDRKIKLFCFDAIERIELSLKSLLTNEMSKDFGTFWYMNEEIFLNNFNHTAEIKRLEKSVKKQKQKKGSFVKHFYDKYTAEKHVPSWILMEVISFGATLTLFKNLKRKYRQKIAKYYGFDEKVLLSWLVLLLDVRNICAHHERLWNRNLKKIIIPKNNSNFSEHGKIWNVFLIFAYLLFVLSPRSELIKRLKIILQESHINLTTMGFSENWEEQLKNINNRNDKN